MWRYLFLAGVVCGACSKSTDDSSLNTNTHKKTLFTRLSADETGIEFINQLELKEDFDVFRYRNYYNGGGVGFGDFNNDGLVDVYLSSNMKGNKLFLNKGNWKFEDITESAGVTGSKIWSTGISIADVNGDGLLDIYVCNAGDVKGGKRENELFINNGDLTFVDKAEEYGLADKGFSTHAVFFDYDKDGDLDCYILNNSYRPVSTLGYRNLRNERDEFGGHKLYRNDEGHFVDVSEHAGIFGSVIGFGLGVTVGDVNQDNWPDLYISNDFYERDYLYINNQDGTFNELIEDYMGHISMFSMGADLADMNNDGYPEIFTTDMLPSDPYRLKTLTAFETYDVYQLRLRNGYYHQFMRNMLHKNNQDGTFSEIGSMAGVDATDWSWGALMADFNNDRNKDIFVSNGIYKDLINQDFLEYLGNNEHVKAVNEGKKVNFKEFTDNMPSVKLSNAMFSKISEWQYRDVSSEWGLSEPSFSNGAAYADIDNDGDLDLIVNNVNQELFIYRNNSQENLTHHYLAINLIGNRKNAFGLGASVKAYVGEEIVYMDHMPIRGFQSSMGYKMIIGLGDYQLVDSIEVIWPDEKQQLLKSIKADQTLTFNIKDAISVKPDAKRIAPTWLVEMPDTTIHHEENSFNDFDRDRLLYHMMSTAGPAFAKADLNNDGLDDFYLGGSVSAPGKIYLQKGDGSFKLTQTIKKDEIVSDDVDAVFFDADGDCDLDLYIVTGGSENTIQSSSLQDYLFENVGLKNGTPNFVKTENRIPRIYQSGSCVRPMDIDNDGDLDLFIGTRVMPSYYGLPCDQFLLVNDGKGFFTDASSVIAPGFKSLGMVTDANWFDYDGNGFSDLIIVGDWMPVTVFLNDGKQLKRKSIESLENTEGWWNRIVSEDIDNDGDLDFVLGNLGLNSKFRPTADSVISLYVNDFDQNGSLEPIFAFQRGELEYTTALRQDIIKQMSSFKKKFLYYKDYAGKSVTDIFSAELLENSTHLKFKQPNTSLLVNNGAAKGFQLIPLPIEAQVSPVFGIHIQDLNNDSHKDIVLAGNLFAVKPEVGRYDALHGLILQGHGYNKFTAIRSTESGLLIEGEVRHIGLLKTRSGEQLTFVRNNNSMNFFKIRK